MPVRPFALPCTTLCSDGTHTLTGSNATACCPPYSLQEAGLPEFGFIVEKMTSSGSTRFEDPYRLPQGLPINHTTFCAKILGGVSAYA